MRAFFLLTRVNLQSMAHAFTRANGTRAMRRWHLAGALAGCIALALVAMGYATLIAITLTSMGLQTVLPTLAVTLGSLSGVAFTFVKANGTLFGSKDFDLVMALPVPRRAVVASRLTVIAGTACGLAWCWMLPLYLVYFLNVSLQPISLIAAATSIVLAPLAPTALAALGAYGITWIAARFRHANVAFVVLGMAALCACIGGVFALQGALGTTTADALHAVAAWSVALRTSIEAVYPPAAWAGAAITTGDAGALLAFTLYSLGAVGLCLELVQRSYLSLNAALKSSPATRGGDAGRGIALNATGTEQAHGPFWTIVCKEVRGVIGVPAYALNCLIGYPFTVGAGALIAFMGLQDLIASGAINGIDVDARQLGELMGVVRLALPWVFAFCGIMCTSSVVSVSMEGRAAWLMCTAPVSTRTMLGAKLASSALPFGASLGIAIGMLWARGEATGSIALECALVGLGAFGLWVNLGMAADVRRPHTTWMNPQDVVKRGAPMMLCVLGGLLYSFAAGAGVIAAALTFGVAAGHVANLALGATTLVLGTLVFYRTVRTHPALYV